MGCWITVCHQLLLLESEFFLLFPYQPKLVKLCNSWHWKIKGLFNYSWIYAECSFGIRMIKGILGAVVWLYESLLMYLFHNGKMPEILYWRPGCLWPPTLFSYFQYCCYLARRFSLSFKIPKCSQYDFSVGHYVKFKSWIQLCIDGNRKNTQFSTVIEMRLARIHW